MSESLIAGWDIGGAHVKACVLKRGKLLDVAQWPCPLWQGMDRLDAVLAEAQERWPMLADTQHAVTMSGEMVDLFAHREAGVAAIAARLAQRFGHEAVQLYAGDAGWCRAADAAAHWPQIASANWLATATHAARRLGSGILVDIGSTTTDLIAFADGRVLAPERSDAERLESGALVYHGVARTPLCAIAPRIAFRGRHFNVMNEFFATSADVYRLTGELDPAHDQHASADGAAKDLASTRQRLARMIGLDARDASADDWQQFAQAWRSAQLSTIASQFDRVLAQHPLAPAAPIISAGCGDFLAAGLPAVSSAASGRPFYSYAMDVCDCSPQSAHTAWIQVCAPSVAVAMLLALDKE
jgi:(4-(4-[2-(gamma-L-glutamylamino)ethyl]phenoxymethyl)furan-2-yl)methanamine synthase